VNGPSCMSFPPVNSPTTAFVTKKPASMVNKISFLVLNMACKNSYFFFAGLLIAIKVFDFNTTKIKTKRTLMMFKVPFKVLRIIKYRL